MGELGFCTIADLTQYLRHNLAIDLAVYSGTPLVLVRLLHNKILYTLLPWIRCYLSYFDTITYGNFMPVLLIPFILYGLLTNPGRKWLWPVQLLLPFFFIINPLYLGLEPKVQIFSGYYYTLAGVGIIKLTYDWIRKRKKPNITG